MKCSNCLKEFEPKQKYCSSTCRVNHHRAKKEGLITPATLENKPNIDELRQLLMPKPREQVNDVNIVEEQDDVEIISDRRRPDEYAQDNYQA